MTTRTRVLRVLAALIGSLLLVTVPARAATPRMISWGPKHTFGNNACRLIATNDAGPVGTGRCPGVRPGAITYIRRGARHVATCTLNFAFKGSDGYTYMGTAGHCVKTSNYEKTWIGYSGPVAYYIPPNKPTSPYYMTYMGTLAYGVVNDTKDFALIRLKAGIKANPKMCYFGGPAGMYQKHDLTPAVLKMFGNGFYWGEALPARTFLAPTMKDPDIVLAVGEGGPGDSGAGVIDQNGQAVGVLVAGLDPRAVGISTSDWPAGVPWVSSVISMTRIDVQVKRAAKVLHTHLSLRTATVSPLSAPNL